MGVLKICFAKKKCWLTVNYPDGSRGAGRPWLSFDFNILDGRTVYRKGSILGRQIIKVDAARRALVLAALQRFLDSI